MNIFKKKAFVYLLFIMSINVIFVSTCFAVTKSVNAKKAPTVIKVSLNKTSFFPKSIKLKKGNPYVLEVAATDTAHRFVCKDLDIKKDIAPGKVCIIEVTPTKNGSFEYTDDKENMRGNIVVH